MDLSSNAGGGEYRATVAYPGFKKRVARVHGPMQDFSMKGSVSAQTLPHFDDLICSEIKSTLLESCYQFDI